MTNKSKQKGTAAETAVVKYLRDEQGLVHVERRALSGENDRGDIAGIPGVVIEVKDAEKKKLSEWQGETLREIENDGALIGALVVKVFRKTPKDWDCYIPFWMLPVVKEAFPDGVGFHIWIRMSLSDFIYLLREEKVIG